MNINSESEYHIQYEFCFYRFTTCISPKLGGSGNPSVPTALGVTMAMEAAMDSLNSSLQGASIAVQGCGNVGRPLIHFLLAKGVKSIIASEPNTNTFNLAKNEFADHSNVEIRLSEFGDNSILYEPVDVVSPCAWGGVLDSSTCAQMQCRVVCGAANSQLLLGDEAEQLRKRNIIYVPDFVANPMGIVNCANEMYGRIGKVDTGASSPESSSQFDEIEDPMLSERLGKEFEHSVYNAAKRVLMLAEKNGVCTDTAASEIAHQLMQQEHPIWGHRALEIQKSLVRNNWHLQASE